MLILIENFAEFIFKSSYVVIKIFEVIEVFDWGKLIIAGTRVIRKYWISFLYRIMEIFNISIRQRKYIVIDN